MFECKFFRLCFESLLHEFIRFLEIAISVLFQVFVSVGMLFNSLIPICKEEKGSGYKIVSDGRTCKIKLRSQHSCINCLLSKKLLLFEIQFNFALWIKVTFLIRILKRNFIRFHDCICFSFLVNSTSSKLMRKLKT